MFFLENSHYHTNARARACERTGMSVVDHGRDDNDNDEGSVTTRCRSSSGGGYYFHSVSKLSQQTISAPVLFKVLETETKNTRSIPALATIFCLR